MFSTREHKEGGSHPGRRSRFWKRAGRYLVRRCRRPRRAARRVSRPALITPPRWVSSAAQMTSPVALAPGSILSRSGAGVGCSTARLRISVKGYLLCTAALPAPRSWRALPGCTGESGLFSLSKTNTLLMTPSFYARCRASVCTGNAHLDKVIGRYFPPDTGFTHYTCLIWQF